MTITRTYAEYCHNLTYDAIPEEVIQYAKQLVMDIVGNSVGAATRARSSRPILAGVRAVDSGAGATALATGESMSPAYAAMVNGSLGHSLDYDDTHRAASIHPSVVTVPAAFAAGEMVNASGRELLTGIVAGHEIACRLGKAINPSAHYDLGFHGTKTCGVFGSTAAAGTILGMDTQQLESAFGVNGSQTSGSLQFLEDGSWNKRIHPGLAAHEALTAVSLASEEFTGASKSIEGKYGFFHGYSREPRPKLATETLGEEFELLRTGLKPYPCCRYMHNALDLLVEMVDITNIRPGDVETITIEIPTPGKKLVESCPGDYPETYVDAQFSMPYGAALVLTGNGTDIDDFLRVLEEPYTETFKRLYDNTKLTSSTQIDEKYPEVWAARVTVTTERNTFERSGDYAKGEPENPMTWDETVAKFEELTTELPDEMTETIVDRIENLEAITVAEFVQPFAEQSERRYLKPNQ